jgi:hypothetical protein
MWFKGPGGFGRIVNLIMSIIMGLALSVYVLWYTQNLPGNEGLPIFTGASYAVSCVVCLGVGYFIGDMFPCLIWGNMLAAKMGVKNKVVKHLVASVVLAFIFITCVSLIMVWVNTFQQGGWPMFFMLWSHLYLQLLVMGFVVIFVFLPFAKAIGKKVAGFSIDDVPMGAAPSEQPQA